MLSAQHVLFHLFLISTLQGRCYYPILYMRELRTQSIKGREGIWTQVYAYLGHGYTSRLNPTSKCSVLPCLHYLWDPASFYAWKSILLSSRPHPHRDQLPANWAGMLLQNQQSENPHLRLNIYLAIASSRDVNAQRLMVTMISFPPGEATLASRWDDNDREGIWCWKCLEVLGVALSCAGEMRSMKPLRIICVIQIQQAFLEGVDSVEPCREAVWRHQDQLMLGAQRRLGPRRTTLSL